jgi:hypothetical protein
METWRNGDMETWAWKHGHEDIYVKIWRHGYGDTWKHIIFWLHGEKMS